MMANSAGKALNRQIREVIIPTIDKYRLSVILQNFGTSVEQTITQNDAYSAFLDASIVLINDRVPQTGRIAYVCPDYYKLIKLDKSFVSYGDKAHELAKTA